MMAGEGVVVRRAQPEDYEGVLAIGETIYKGRDVLPFMYSRYVSDQDKMCFVMLRQGEVVAFVALRNFDGGTSYEAIAARTKQTVRGKLLMMYMGEEIKKQIVSSQFITAKHKQRFVVMNLEKMPKKEDMVVQGYRITIQLTWKSSVLDINESMMLLQKLYPSNTNTPPLFDINLEQLRMILSTPTQYQDLFLPNGIVIVENQTYQLGYTDNANLILKHGLTKVSTSFSSISDDMVKSLSFCTPIPCGNAMDILRIGIEYYGPEDTDLMFKHFQKHFKDIPDALNMYPKVKGVSLHLFMPKVVATDGVLSFLKDMATKLKFNAWQINNQAYGLIDHTAEVRARTDEDRKQRATKHKASL